MPVAKIHVLEGQYSEARLSASNWVGASLTFVPRCSASLRGRCSSNSLFIRATKCCVTRMGWRLDGCGILDGDAYAFKMMRDCVAGSHKLR
jgi:hypothetical protein